MNPQSPPSEGHGTERHEFLSNVGHELRNPLTTIIAQVEILMEGVHGPLEDAQKNALCSVQDSARQMLHLLTDTIDLFKIEAKDPELVPGACVLADICAQSLPPALDLARSRSVEVQTQMAPGLRVTADARRLRQIITEALSAAVLTVPTGSTVQLVINDDSDGLSIQANRQPMPASCATHVILGGKTSTSPWLERLRKVKPVGTALLHWAVQLLGGSLTMAEEAGQIAGITIHLPLEILPPETLANNPAGPAEASPLPASEILATKQRTILIADDQQALVTVVSNYLENVGFNIVVARDGREAVQMAASHRPDLIMMDVRMPEMDGLAAIREIRASPDPQVRDITIVSLSGIVHAADRQDCLDAGASDYLNKPFGIRDLDRIINSYLRPKS